jgi:hypothetical protein
MPNLDDLLDHWCNMDLEYRSHGRRIRQLQRRLRDQVDGRAWHTFLELEEVMNERLIRILELVSQERHASR